MKHKKERQHHRAHRHNSSKPGAKTQKSKKKKTSEDELDQSNNELSEDESDSETDVENEDDSDEAYSNSEESDCVNKSAISDNLSNKSPQTAIKTASAATLSSSFSLTSSRNLQLSASSNNLENFPPQVCSSQSLTTTSSTQPTQSQYYFNTALNPAVASLSNGTVYNQIYQPFYGSSATGQYYSNTNSLCTSKTPIYGQHANNGSFGGGFYYSNTYPTSCGGANSAFSYESRSSNSYYSYSSDKIGVDNVSPHHFINGSGGMMSMNTTQPNATAVMQPFASNTCNSNVYATPNEHY